MVRAEPFTLDDDRIPVGVSACLLGQEVRFDGGHKHSRYLTEILSTHLRFVSTCPEMELGLGTPRESLRLVHGEDGPRLVAPRSESDHTDAMRAFAARKVEALRGLGLCGFVLKKDSPSCGLMRVKVYGAKGSPSRDGSGLFAAALQRAMPHLPVEEEGRLNDPVLRENFLERVFAYHRVQRLFASDWSQGDLVEFHAREKLLLLSHDEERYRELGRLVAGAKDRSREGVRELYVEGFMTALSRHASARRQINVLQHVLGFFKDRLDPATRYELLQAIDDYRAGHVSLSVPVTLLGHYARLQGVDYLTRQSWLAPHPKDLALRTHV